MTPADVPAELAQQGADAVKRHFADEQNPFRPAHHGGPLMTEARLVLAAVWPAIEKRVRAEVASDLQRAAAGRRDYATRAPAHIAAELEAEAKVFDTAAKVAVAPCEVMWGLLPADMWTDADRPERGDS
ncbi:hypothetical protein ACFVH6_22065 [Spirillospora sp. NPDC127200]